MPKPEQPAYTGSGPFFERRYWLDVQHPRQSAAELLDHVKCHLPDFSPDLLADFEKSKGAAGCLEVGDEFRIKILGPWNGDVRVTDLGADFFELATLENHPEAGRIRFSLRPHDTLPATVRFEIHSWARSRDGLVAFTYDTLGLGRLVQQQTWETFCERVGKLSGGLWLGPVQVETIRRDENDVVHATPDA
ncbi:hypothetical protein CDA63_08175 [Hymenobacter amundsenii]|uniref:DUF1990 domain-containing protein n=1 Tax=Hymenobacter amundsenii TaxID=2006685 RepID=A0A246FLF3_9BACT|nr:DUF1990 family protein [Hymenobacter amundsenii]OWP63550.1 hypothetical protein CDA63_08175 [Hymenobacter amundsenii]